MTGSPGHEALPGFEVRPLEARPARLFSVDVEEWFHSNFRSAPALDSHGLPRRAGEGVKRLLEALSAARSRATFFVLGELAREQPEVVRGIAGAGHEVCCHSLHHTLLYEQEPAAVARDLKDARALLQDLSGQPVYGFRAPSWSITARNLWALELIAEAGFRYDSSLFPAENYLYGLRGGPTRACRLRTPGGASLLEIPPSTIGLGRRRVGVGGGFYLRVLPLAVHALALERALSRGEPFVLYVHPRELDPGSWKLSVPLDLGERIIHEAGLRLGAERIARLLGRGSWQSFDTLLDGAPPS